MNRRIKALSAKARKSLLRGIGKNAPDAIEAINKAPDEFFAMCQAFDDRHPKGKVATDAGYLVSAMLAPMFRGMCQADRFVMERTALMFDEENRASKRTERANRRSKRR